MTNTKFRKRALLSSVAMLLVALVALGSATFAWFSTTNNATASSLTAKTNKASNILLNEYKTDNSDFAHTWAQTLTLNQNTATSTTNGVSAMEPVTTKDFANWNQVKAEAYNQGYATTNTYSAVNNIKSSGQYAKYTTLYVMNTGENTAATIAATATLADSSNSNGIDYLRVALVPITANSRGTTAALSQIAWGDFNDRSNVTAGWTAHEADADHPSGQAADSIYGSTAHAFGSAQSLGTLAKDAIYGYDVWVYYEGTDFDCRDAFAGGEISVAFTVTKAGA